jgi:hypothetical protein
MLRQLHLETSIHRIIRAAYISQRSSCCRPSGSANEDAHLVVGDDVRTAQDGVVGSPARVKDLSGSASNIVAEEPY